MKNRRVSLLAAAVVAVAGFSATPANAIPPWAPGGTVHPGVQTVSPSGQCTANFVFYDSANDIYIGQAAHCTTTGGATDTNGCLTGSRPTGTHVNVTGSTYGGTMVYNSWLAMQAVPEPTNSAQCSYNDIAIVKLDSRDYGKVNPSIPFWGGPTGTNTAGTSLGSRVYSYGNSGLRGGVTQLSPKFGIATGTSSGGWTHSIYTISPGIPGDSGSAVVDGSGRALGVLATLSATGSNGVGDLNHELNYIHAHSALTSLTLALGTTAWAPLPV